MPDGGGLPSNLDESAKGAALKVRGEDVVTAGFEDCTTQPVDDTPLPAVADSKPGPRGGHKRRGRGRWHRSSGRWRWRWHRWIAGWWRRDGSGQHLELRGGEPSDAHG